MDLQPYVDAVRHELNLAAAAAGADAQQLAGRLSAPLESAMRLALLEALSAAAEEISGELAPRSVEVRLRGRDPEFVVSAALDEPAFDILETTEGDADTMAGYDHDGGIWRVTLRLPEGLRAGVEAAARQDGSSLNAWLVRAAAGASQRAGRAGRKGAHHVTGWVR
ncbi:hypothetical protein MB901379_01651 [Mycobacterium basiliense]|uniref:HicB family protein n=1 Tax=Mycobacterium basiliense TaxID=2094119 RepID=A0A447GCB3_9MYCO|nr:histidine kinase [Mycobacterium basiliense]VDM88095.1 hypothetical protein MB901379_01651 [Mycobacterium basiliense]